jgi:uncharacterized protein YbaR (Trm112 family)
MPDDDPDADPETRADAPPAPAAFDRKMLEALVCPVTQGQLGYDSARQELISRTARLAFPIRNGIPIMLASEAREIDT